MKQQAIENKGNFLEQCQKCKEWIKFDLEEGIEYSKSNPFPVPDCPYCGNKWEEQNDSFRVGKSFRLQCIQCNWK